ncbi:FAD-dependent oxidoreductase [Salinisphaera aquimarina]|uniref:FAD-dependent oxidoreductase n=1 Tax=Salinisphaera aquimarina TaxID=2094031 RepID=A0ABV7ETU9_9GAMM
MTVSRILLALIAIGLVTAYFLLDPGQYLGGACSGKLFSLGCFESQRSALGALVASNPLLAAGGFFLIYVLVTALSVPGAAVMTLVGGALFGLVEGVLLVSFASAIGATLAFLMARFVLRDSVQKKFGRRLAALNRGVDKDGAFYLFALRLVPVFPFFVINLAMGLTPIPVRTFYWVSQLGMLAGTIVYVNAGTQLGQLQSLSGVLSPGLIGSFVLLGLFPLIARKTLDAFAARKALKGHSKPSHFDRNVIVIGAGSAGLVSALIAATVKAKVTLIEKGEMGGDCLNTGCVPSKALIRTAKLMHEIRNSERYGIRHASAEFEFADVMARVKSVVATIAPHDSVERFESLGVDCIKAGARLIDPWTVEIDDGRRLTARNIVLATGAAPFVPPIDGLADIDVLTSDNLWDLTELPERLAVMGAGPIGCEMAQAFARLGSRVTLIEQEQRLLSVEDEDIGVQMAELFTGEGIDLRLEHKVTRARRDQHGVHLRCEAAAGDVDIVVDRVLVAVGRRARTTGMGLEELGIARDGRIAVNERLQTNLPTVYACGDAIDGYQLTHAASHEAWHATVNALFGTFKSFAIDYAKLPWCTFTDPQVAHVGHNEQSARAADIEYEVTRYDLAELDRAIAESATSGVVKVLTVPGKDTVLGATIVGEAAGELITEFVTAMKQGIGLNKILSTIHAYPTLAEANKFAAGEWKKAHAPEWVFPWLTRLHAWRR